MTRPPLGRLKSVPLRVAWESESGEFTPWLSREENTKLLGEALGLDLEVEAQERNVGPFRADIWYKNTGRGRLASQRRCTCHPGNDLAMSA